MPSSLDMSIPYMTLWSPSRPLLIGVLLTLICGLALLVEAGVLVGRGARPQHVPSVRPSGAVPALAGIGSFILASRIWDTYFQIACPYPNVESHPAFCLDPDRAAAAVQQFQPFEWGMVLLTVVLLLLGVILLRRTQQPPGARQVAP